MIDPDDLPEEDLPEQGEDDVRGDEETQARPGTGGGGNTPPPSPGGP